jgi:hypothetical protein
VFFIHKRKCPFQELLANWVPEYYLRAFDDSRVKLVKLAILEHLINSKNVAGLMAELKVRWKNMISMVSHLFG